MKSIYTLMAVVSMTATSFAAAGDKTCDKACDKSATACEKSCDKEKDCDKASCDAALAGAREFVVTGMKCGSCSGKLTKALASLEGVSAVKVCHKSGHAALVIDQKKGSEAAVFAAIEKSGLKLAGERVKVKLAEAQCQSCPKALAASITGIEGVTALEGVCHKSGTAYVVIDPSKTTQAKVLAAVAPAAETKG